MKRQIAAILLLGLLLGCSDVPPVPSPPPVPRPPRPCDLVYSVGRCKEIGRAAARYLGLGASEIATVAIVVDPNPGEVTTGLGISLQVRGRDGIVRDTIICVGADSGPACTDDPHLEAQAGTHSGYHDLPCSGDPPDGCATPVPTIDPAAAAEARPLSVAHVTIPIDHVGAYAVVVGTATLPNGILTDSSFGFADDWPDGVSIVDSTVRLEVRSKADGQPIANIYEHGWSEGVEPVEAVLVFVVDAFEPGAVLDIKDIVVR